MGKRETSRGFSSSTAGTTVLTSSLTSNPETTIFSEVIPGTKMGTNKTSRLEMLVTLTSQALSLPSLTFKVKLGSSSLTLFSGVSLLASQTNTPFVIKVKIRNKNAANSQIVFAEICQSDTNSPLAIMSSMTKFAIWSEDTTVDKTLSVTAQFGGLSANASITVQDADLDLS